MIVFTLLLLAITQAAEKRNKVHYGHVGEGIFAVGTFHEHEMNADFMKSLMARAEKPVGQTEDVPGSPVIFIPGMTGSVIEAKLEDKTDKPLIICSSNSDWYTVYAGTDLGSLSWDVMLIMGPEVYKCTFDNLQMMYASETGHLFPKEGVETRLKGQETFTADFDPENPMAGIGSFDADLHFGLGTGLAPMLEMFGYQQYVDLWHAAYDFRKTSVDFQDIEYPQLKALTEYVYELNGNRKVAFIGISMGGPYLSSFMLWLDEEWKETYVESIITFAGVFGGAMYNLGTLIFGETYGIPYIDAGEFQDMYETWGCSVWLTPMEGFEENRVIIEVTEEDGTITEYHVDELVDFLASVPDLHIAYELKRDYLNEAIPMNQPYHDPNVKTHCMYSANIPTPQVFQLERNDIQVYDPERMAEQTEHGDFTGDGVANYPELAVCRDWANTRVWEADDHPHAAESSDPDHWRYVIGILKGQGENYQDCKETHVVQSDCVNEDDLECPEGYYAVDDTQEVCWEDNSWFCWSNCEKYHQWCVKEDWWFCPEDQKCGQHMDDCLEMTTPTEDNVQISTSGTPETEDLAISAGECELYANSKDKKFELRSKNRFPTGCFEHTITWLGESIDMVLFQRSPTEAECSEDHKCVSWIGTGETNSEALVEEEVAQPEIVVAKKRTFEVYLAIFAFGAILGAWHFTGTKTTEQVPLLDDEV